MWTQGIDTMPLQKKARNFSGHVVGTKFWWRNLLQSVHQPSDGAVQILVGAAHFLDLVDGVQHSGVMLAAKLAANFRQRRGRELLDDVHGDLARKGDGASITADL